MHIHASRRRSREKPRKKEPRKKEARKKEPRKKEPRKLCYGTSTRVLLMEILY